MHHKEDRSVFSVPIVQSFNRFALQGIEPFQSFQPFHRFAPFTPFNPIQVVQRSTVQSFNERGELPRSRIPERRNLAKSYFSRPRRRRSFPAEIAPSLFIRTLDLSMILRNLRLVLRARVSSSALRRVTTATKGFPLLYTTTGAFLAFVAYYESGPDFLNSTFVIALILEAQNCLFRADARLLFLCLAPYETVDSATCNRRSFSVGSNTTRTRAPNTLATRRSMLIECPS